MEHSHTSILALLQDYKAKLPSYAGKLRTTEIQKETETIERFVSFLNSGEAVFSRENAFGHFCGSAWLVDPLFQKVVLTHHAKLKKWIQLGGHADDDSDLFRVALKEAREESGLQEIEALRNKEGECVPFDFSIHDIPPNKNVPAHLHFDVTYVFVAKDKELVCSDESFDVRWFTFAEAYELVDAECRYQLRKLQSFLGHIDKS